MKRTPAEAPLTMTPIRVRLGTRLGTILFGSFLPAIFLGLAFLGALTKGSGFDGFDLGFAIIIGVAILCALVFGPLALNRVLWIEIGSQLAYGTLLRVHAWKWSTIETLQFRHEVCYQVSYKGGSQWITYTVLVISFLDHKRHERLRIEKDCFWKPHVGLDDLIPGLITALGAEEAASRRDAARIFGYLLPDALHVMPRSGHVRWGIQSYQQTEAFQSAQAKAEKSQAALREALAHLEKATNDVDPAVRNAAVESLHRLNSR